MGQLENSDTDEFSIVKTDESFSPNGTMWQDRVEKNAEFHQNLTESQQWQQSVDRPMIRWPKSLNSVPYIYIIFLICAKSKTKRSRGFAFPMLRILMWIN